MNRYALLVAVVGLVISHWIAYNHGVKTERGSAAIAQQEAVSSAAKAARSDAEIESKRRQEAALRNERAEAVSREARLKGQINALQSSRAECRWPADRLHDIGTAVDAANSSDASDGIMLEGMPTTSETTH